VTVPTERIRNVLVLGHTGVGKTTLVEAMLAEVGLATHGGGQLDHEPEERARGHSLSLAVASFTFDGHQLNLLDAPGGAEATGDAYPALLAADTALFVVDATVGLQPQHEQLWRACEERGIPRVLFLNRFDLDRARYQERIDELRDRYGDRIAPVHMPLGLHEEFDGIIDVLHGVAVEVHDGQRVQEPIPEERREQAAHNREALIESVVETDDDLLERYLDGDVPSNEELAGVFAHGIAEAGFFPVLVGSAATGVGIDLLLHFLIEECPSPNEASHPLPHDGPTVVVTHHAPSRKSIRGAVDVSDASFASDCEDLMRRYRPELWVHGHVHQRCHYWVGDTQVVCNPRGYASDTWDEWREETGIEEDFVLEV
jgi:elongation factor G